MIPDCDGRSDGQTVRQTESIIAKTALCIASYADALSKTVKSGLRAVINPAGGGEFGGTKSNSC